MIIILLYFYTMKLNACHRIGCVKLFSRLDALKNKTSREKSACCLRAATNISIPII
ncbi:Hypothetical protein PP7435_CHR2-1979 [Komagataella phaffii CBS 7435]|uniref:Uncharacterized protein n=1 Tax=Komagataella phaffii (strain ATCC 76273 / CBS 7435 / CECT 11047 / NRRL Y-11430 / Wegner 21-1) TaxID=981350 RepID=A0A1G4KPT8_KOMPC|nr:Hypothetical protein BQ9382_C2-2798 [Komagataella phaffii CBS 7435]SCV12027.1 Hypothetical protein PP7435_CHR2-1979 [Komagataella phaffii CBS 7435]